MFPLLPLSGAQRDVVERAGALARERFAPRAARHDADATFPEDNYADLHHTGRARHRDALAGPVMPPANDRCLETAGKLLCGLRAATLEFQ